MTNLLVLGGTAWLGREVARQAVERSVEVTCLARGNSGAAPEGVHWVSADRTARDAYAAVQATEWDAVVDVSWQPGLVAGAVVALGERAAHWTYVSSCSVYSAEPAPGVDESSALAEPLMSDLATMDDYSGAKVRCEQLVVESLGERAFLARAGLIVGPGDPSDRFGYWVGRLAAAGESDVIAPLPADALTQVLDVRDLAAWLVCAPDIGLSGPMNAVGPPVRFGDLLREAAAVAAFTGQIRWAEPSWLEENDVQPWAGPRSLPLWAGAPFWFSDRLSGTHGLTRRALADTLVDTLADERARGLARPRRAGLSRADELVLLGRLT